MNIVRSFKIYASRTTSDTFGIEVISRLQRLELVDDLFPGPLAQAVTFRAVGALATQRIHFSDASLARTIRE
jgi:hypothetical protein